MIKVILWDIDGTLLNFKAAEKAGVRSCFKIFRLGECTDAMIEDYSAINDKFWKMLERGEIEKPVLLVERFREFFVKYGVDTSCVEAFNAEYQQRLADTCIFNDDGRELVALLKGRVLQYAATNGTIVAQDKKLRASGLDRLLDGAFISDRIGIDKPNREYFEKAFRILDSEHPELELFPARDDAAASSLHTAAAGSLSVLSVSSDTPAGSLSFSGAEAAAAQAADASVPLLSKEKAGEIMIVGDSLTSDIKGGNNAGILTCWYNPGHAVNDKGMQVDYEISDLRELPELLDRLQ